MRSSRWLTLCAFLVCACKKPAEDEPERHAPAKPAAKSPAKTQTPSDPPATTEPSGPRYLRPNSSGALVDAFQFPSVPAFMVEQQVANASTRSDAAGILKRFGLAPLEGKTGQMWIAKASLVDRAARERVLVVSFRGEDSEDGWIVFLGSTEDDRVLKIGNARLTTKTTPEPAEIDAHELHSHEVDDVVATWSSCTKPMQKGCNFLRAWTMQRGYPEMIIDVAGDSKPVVSTGAPPHDVTVDGRVWKFDQQAFAYK